MVVISAVSPSTSPIGGSTLPADENAAAVKSSRRWRLRGRGRRLRWERIDRRAREAIEAQAWLAKGRRK
jgi:hypothetical protein